MIVQHADSSALADIISTVEFDHTGNYLATGDKGGRVVLFERNESVGNPFLKKLAKLITPLCYEINC